MITKTRKIRLIIGTCFAGKTYLKKQFDKDPISGVTIVDSDMIRGTLKGWNNELWPAWKPDHSLHLDWLHFQDLMEREYARIIKETNQIVITHGPIAGVAFDQCLLIDPPYDTIIKRIIEYREYCKQKKEDYLNRIDAYLSCEKRFQIIGIRQFANRVTSADAALRFLRNQYLKEES